MKGKAESLQGIRDVLSQLRADKSLKQGVTELLNELGYSSNRTLEARSVPKFLSLFGADGKLSEARQRLIGNCKRIDFVFQVTGEELQNHGSGLDTVRFDSGRAASFVFLAVEMICDNSSRTLLSSTARDLSSFFAMPVIVIFRDGTNLTLAVTHRRPNLRDDERDVLGKVTLIKDINLTNPHRAHVEILTGLDLRKLIESGVRSFDDLHQEWKEALDVEALNKRFYSELFQWFEHAVASCTFPDDGAGEGSTERHAIRLITRILFIWFMKEKRLIPESLFDEEFVVSVLHNHAPEASDYYRAILQNLFFATLNTEIGERTFGKDETFNNADPSKYQYQSLLSDPVTLMTELNNIPFVNGGLFDCLDVYSQSLEMHQLVDAYGEFPFESTALRVPAHLFFDSRRGLYPLLHRYKFTVEENTPLDREVALDPELLGSVFENLLAAYNPETREIARKKTGSYYTPREVVDYMVRESLTEAIVAKTGPEDGDDDFWRDRLLYLFDHSDAMADADELFEYLERKSIVSAIAELRTIDPAAGSGAFPMGILQTLTLALRRLDANNELWEEIQKQRAQDRVGDALDIDDQQARDEALKEISAIFENYRRTDFGRKLYLIQNAIYGVDIQTIACQIAKLRFFISLVIEQKVSTDRDTNFGIRPLPNLETKFIAADSLIRASIEHTFGLTGVRSIVDELSANRERHFNATSPVLKKDCRSNDERLRKDLSNVLIQEGFGDEDVEKIVEWNPYDQNSVAAWFEPAYMFGVEQFDVVIGNPPYVQLQRNQGELRKKYIDAGYEVFASTGDIYQLFFERGIEIARERSGIVAYISSNSWLKANYGRKLRSFFSDLHTPLTLVELGKDVFENAIVDSSILVVRRGKLHPSTCRAIDTDQLVNDEFPPAKHAWGVLIPRNERPWMALSTLERDIMDKVESVGKQLKYWDISIYYGIKTGFNKAFVVDQETHDELVAADSRSSEILKPVLRGRDIARYQANWANLWLISTFPSLALDIDTFLSIRDHLLGFGKHRLAQTGLQLPSGENARKKTPHEWFELQDSCAYHALFDEPKLVWRTMAETTTERGAFVFDEKGAYYPLDSAFMMCGNDLRYLYGVLNSPIVSWFVSKSGLTTGMGIPSWKKFVVDEIPVFEPNESVKSEFVKLVSQLMSAVKREVSEEIRDLENTINSSIEKMYDLTTSESAALARKVTTL